MPIQDNLNGALLISAIDFILSFVIIAGIGMILALFPLLNKFGKQGDQCRPIDPPDRSAPNKPDAAVALPTGSSPRSFAAEKGIHPGLSDQQLVVLLTAAAYQMIGGPVRVEKFRQLSSRSGNWAAQGRSALQSHRLK